MAVSTFDDSNYDPSLYLNSNEQDLLLTALSSNKPQHNQAATLVAGTNSTPKKAGTNNSHQTPEQIMPGSNSLQDIGFDNSPFLDYELDESNFDWDLNGQMIGGLPGTSSNGSNGNDDDADDSASPDGESGDKRKSPDDQNEEDGGGKRREGDDKNNKKPGRKPLTSEPTTKRKAQNRAAQRAFRERKERHLKELETKVDDLEKASDSANHENSLLRAQVERLQTELKEYRKRLSLGANPIRTSPQASSHALSPKTNWDINNNFQFAFPKFGPLGTDPNAINGSHRSNGESVTSPTSISRSNSGQQTTFAGSTDDLSDLFSPSVLAGINSTSGSMSNKPRTKKHNSETNTASPCSSAAHSSSNGGFISSSATTPEFSPESPEQRKASEAAGDTQRRGSTTHETFCKNFQTACGNKQNPVPAMMSESDTSPASASSMGNLPNTPGFDTSSFDWIANQNGGGFDPVLFGDYRDPQDNIMNNDFAFFDNAFAMPDFDHSATTTQPIEPVLPKKKDLMQQIEESQADKDNEVVPGENAKQFLTCNMLWDRVQRSQKVQSGEADMDDLCSQLKSKAKCSGNGAVIEQKDVDAILGPAPDDTKDFFKMFK